MFVVSRATARGEIAPDESVTAPPVFGVADALLLLLALDEVFAGFVLPLHAATSKTTATRTASSSRPEPRTETARRDLDT